MHDSWGPGRLRWDPPYPGGRRGRAVDTHFRASDAERNEVAERLARHFADGRLDQAEYRARLDRAMGATTRGDLDGIFDDLPPLPEDAPPHPSPRRRPMLVALAVVAVVVASAAALSAPFEHFPFALFVFVGLFLWWRVGRHPHYR